VSAEVAQKGKDGIGQQLAKAVGRGKIEPQAAEQALALIEAVGDLSRNGGGGPHHRGRDRKEHIKRAIFADAGKVLGKDAVLATNTSSISITRLAQASPDPARFIGIHFFNPVPLMKLVEIIPGLATSETTVETATNFAKAIGKTSLRAKDSALLRRESRARADAQRSLFRAWRGRGVRDRHRSGREARPRPPDGAAGAFGHDRAGYDPGNLPHPPIGFRRSQISAPRRSW
jgi:hypothetical protein